MEGVFASEGIITANGKKGEKGSAMKTPPN
jgi:hypothetical protein